MNLIKPTSTFLVICAGLLFSNLASAYQADKCELDLECVPKHLNEKIRKKIGTDLMKLGKAKQLPEDADYSHLVEYNLEKPTTILGNKIPEKSKVIFFVFKDDVQLVRISTHKFINWDQFGLQSIFKFCKWTLSKANIDEGRSFEGIRAIKALAIIHFYTDGKIKAVATNGHGVFEFQGKKYTEKDSPIFLKREGSLYSKDEIRDLKIKFDKENPSGQLPEWFICNVHDDVRFIPDDFYTKHAE